MTTNPQEETTEEVAAHSSVGMLIAKVDKAVNKNLAMTVGEFWKYHLKAVLVELHKYHIDYTDDAVEDVDGGDVDPAYVEALVDFVHEGKEMALSQIKLASACFAHLNALDAQGMPVKEKMPADVQALFVDAQQRIAAWMIKYPELIDEDVANPQAALTPAPEPQVQVIPPTTESPSNGVTP